MCAPLVLCLSQSIAQVFSRFERPTTFTRIERHNVNDGSRCRCIASVHTCPFYRQKKTQRLCMSAIWRRTLFSCSLLFLSNESSFAAIPKAQRTRDGKRRTQRQQIIINEIYVSCTLASAHQLQSHGERVCHRLFVCRTTKYRFIIHISANEICCVEPVVYFVFDVFCFVFSCVAIDLENFFGRLMCCHEAIEAERGTFRCVCTFASKNIIIV